MNSDTVAMPSRTRRDILRGAAAVLAFSPLSESVASTDPAEAFALGVASGYPRPESVVLWTRVIASSGARSLPVHWELAADEGFQRIVARGTELAHADDAFSVHAEPSGLDPARTYWYRFEALGVRSPVGRTRTAPAPASSTTLRLAIASCQRFDTGHYAAWARVANQPIDLVVFLGDYIYEYPTRADAIRPVGPRVVTLEEYRARYAVHRSDQSLRSAHASHPWLVIWDDHEVDNDYAAITGQALQPDFERIRADAYKAWWEHMPVPKAWRPQGGTLRIYDRLDWGRLARIHLLDTRQYRDLQACPRTGRGGSNSVTLAECPEILNPSRTMLGAEQERWFASGLDPDRPWNLIAQSTLMARSAFGPPGLERHWTDGWDGYPAARRRLLEAISGQKITGPLVLGGDVHTHVAADLRLDFENPDSPVVASEFCCTSISSLGPPQSRVDASRAANPHIRYARSDQRGHIELTIDRRYAQADLVVVDEPNDPLSACRIDARFIVSANQPGVRAA